MLACSQTVLNRQLWKRQSEQNCIFLSFRWWFRNARWYAHRHESVVSMPRKTTIHISRPPPGSTNRPLVEERVATCVWWWWHLLNIMRNSCDHRFFKIWVWWNGEGSFRWGMERKKAPMAAGQVVWRQINLQVSLNKLYHGQPLTLSNNVFNLGKVSIVLVIEQRAEKWMR